MLWRADDAPPAAAPCVAALCAADVPSTARDGLEPAAPVAAAPLDTIEALVGQHLRRLRHARRWSLDRLSAATGVSRAMLGQIELGKSAPTVRVLARIAGGLGVDVTTLLAPVQPARLQVFRADATATSSSDPAPASAVRTLGTALAGSVAFHTLRLAPGDTASHPQAQLAGRVVAVVARGTVEVSVGGETLTLEEHDALQIDAAAALRWRNAGAVTALIHAVSARSG